jgi:tetratricopeptide (TPR) repeat protein
MASLFDFSQAISKLNKEKKFAETLKYFKENKTQFTTEQIASNDYLISAMLTALRQTGNFDNAFKFLELYKITIDENTKEIILTAYGWLLYSKFKAENQLNDNHQIESEIFDEEEIETTSNHHYNKTEIIQKIEYFLPLILKVNNEFAYSVVSNLFTSVLKAEKKKPNANWKLVSDICDLISPEMLHTDCRTIEVERKGQKKPMELASDKENWYAFKSKALMKLGIFQECYEVSKQALDLFEVFHYSNDIWFARRIALSKKNLGNSADAIDELQRVLKRKKEWFIQKELAVLYQEAGEIDKAFNYAISAINNFGDLEYKVDLLFLLGELLKSKQEDDLAFKHFSLSQLIRIKEEWNIPSKLQSALSQFKTTAITVDKLQELKGELRKYWNSFNPQQSTQGQNTNQRQTGKIEKILHNDEKGADGFIKFDNNKSIYFRVNSTEEIIKKLNVGLMVEFKILPATEDKKEKAIQLKVKV